MTEMIARLREADTLPLLECARIYGEAWHEDLAGRSPRAPGAWDGFIRKLGLEPVDCRRIGTAAQRVGNLCDLADLDAASQTAIVDGVFPLMASYELKRLPVSLRPALIDAESSKAVPAKVWRIQQAVRRMLNDKAVVDEDDEEALDEEVNERGGPVDTSDVIRIGAGSGTVYAYGYRGLDRTLKIGCTNGTAEERIADQICTGSPGRPMLVLEIKTDRCRQLERLLHAHLGWHGKRIVGGGAEWFAVAREEVVAFYERL